MGSIGADQPLLAGWRAREQVAADVAGRQTKSAQAADLQMSEVLAHPAALGQHFAERRGDGGGLGIIMKFLVDAPRQVHNALKEGSAGRKGRPAIIEQLRRHLDVAGIEYVLVSIERIGTTILADARGSFIPGEGVRGLR